MYQKKVKVTYNLERREYNLPKDTETDTTYRTDRRRQVDFKTVTWRREYGTASLETTTINQGKPTSTANVALKSDAQILVMTLLWASQRRIGRLTSSVS